MRLIDATTIEQYMLNNCSDTEEINAIYAEIINAPTVEAEPIKRGRWIERTKVHPDLLNESTYNYECSNCGYWDTHGADVEVPYCWHCGAKMDVPTQKSVDKALKALEVTE